jgi:hypothetical protein
MWGTITPKMKIHIKRSSNESTQIIDGKANSLARNSEPEMIMTLIRNPKIFCKSTQTGFLVELKEISPESC